jgi:hypothetical protein
MHGVIHASHVHFLFYNTQVLRVKYLSMKMSNSEYKSVVKPKSSNSMSDFSKLLLPILLPE